jgi:hypothetical protein
LREAYMDHVKRMLEIAEALGEELLGRPVPMMGFVLPEKTSGSEPEEAEAASAPPPTD